MSSRPLAADRRVYVSCLHPNHEPAGGTHDVAVVVRASCASTTHTIVNPVASSVQPNATASLVAYSELSGWFGLCCGNVRIIWQSVFCKLCVVRRRRETQYFLRYKITFKLTFIITSNFITINKHIHNAERMDNWQTRALSIRVKSSRDNFIIECCNISSRTNYI